MRFNGKVAMITGGASGLGLATAQRFVAEGAKVIIADLDSTAASKAANSLNAGGPVRAISVHCDVADEASMIAAVEAATASLGGIDIFVANAGLHLSGYTVSPCALSSDEWRRLLDVNVIGIVNGARACRKVMADRGGGVIVTLVSMAAFKDENAYGISKLAVRGLTVAMAKELAEDGIRVCGVAPGLIGTESVMDNFPNERRDRYVNEIQLVKRLGKPEDIAATIAFLASSDADFITGETIVASGGAVCRN